VSKEICGAEKLTVKVTIFWEVMPFGFVDKLHGVTSQKAVIFIFTATYRIFGNLKFIGFFLKSPLQDPEVKEMHSLLPSRLRFSKRYLPFRFSENSFYLLDAPPILY
jgi:hypothetical protein